MLAASNTYTGATLINLNGQASSPQTSGHLQIGVTNALPTTTDVIFDTLVKGGQSVLDLNGYNQQIASLSCGQYANGGNEIFNGVVGSAASTSTLTVSGTTTPYYPFNGIIADTNGNDLNATVALVKKGPNTLMLTGPSSFSGGTTIYAGSLLVNGGSVGTPSPTGDGPVLVSGGTFGGINLVYGAATVASGATLAPGLPGFGATAKTPGTLTFYSGLTLNAGSIVSFNDFSGGSGNSDQVAAGSLTLPTTGSVTINVANDGWLTAGSYQLITGSLAAGNTATLTVQGPSGLNYTLSDPGSAIDLTVTPSATASFTSTGGSASWQTALVTTPSSTVTLGNSSSAASTIALNGNQSAAALVFNPSGSNSITLSPGSGGTLTLGTGGSGSITTSSSGGVAISAPVSLAGNLTVSLTGGSTLQLANVSQGTTASALDLTGNGELILSGSDAYTGGTTVNGGTLIAASAGALEAGSSLTVGTDTAIFHALPLGGVAASSAGSPAAVPEPGTFALLAVGGTLIALGAWRRRKK